MSPALAHIQIAQRVERLDVDPSGTAHWTTIGRFAEAAEAALHTSLGIVNETFGYTPRLQVSMNLRRPLKLGDEAQVELAVTSVGRSAVSYRLSVIGPEGAEIADGKIITCLVDASGLKARPWPDHMRRALTDGGDQSAIARAHFRAT